MKKLLFLLACLILISTFSQAATIEGGLYDLSLKNLKNVIVEINTFPKQRVIAVNGYYKFESVPLGNYTILAYTKDKELTAKEEITILQEGTYRVDLFLLPEIPTKEEKSYSWLAWIIGLMMVIILVAIFATRKKQKPKHEKKELKEDLQELVKLIKKLGSRTTQKELVKQTGLSEAKISLMLTELEDLGKIKRIKKGRTNVVVLK